MTLKIKQPVIAAEIRTLTDLLFSQGITSKNVNVTELCEALGTAFKDGQLGPVNRLLEGLTPFTISSQTDGFPALSISGRTGAQPCLYLTAGAGGGKIIDTTIPSLTGAYLSSTGTWTDAACTPQAKVVYALPIGVLTKLKQLKVQRFRRKVNGKARGARHLGLDLREFKRLFGVGENDGIAALDVAALAILALQQTLRKVEEIERRLTRLEAKHGANATR